MTAKAGFVKIGGVWFRCKILGETPSKYLVQYKYIQKWDVRRNPDVYITEKLVSKRRVVISTSAEAK